MQVILCLVVNDLKEVWRLSVNNIYVLFIWLTLYHKTSIAPKRWDNVLCWNYLNVICKHICLHCTQHNIIAHNFNVDRCGNRRCTYVIFTMYLRDLYDVPTWSLRCTYVIFTMYLRDLYYVPTWSLLCTYVIFTMYLRDLYLDECTLITDRQHFLVYQQ